MLSMHLYILFTSHNPIKELKIISPMLIIYVVLIAVNINVYNFCSSIVSYLWYIKKLIV